MDRFCSGQLPYRPTTGQVYMNYLRLDGQEESVGQCFRAFDLSSQPLSPSKLEMDQRRRRARLAQETRDQWARFEQGQTAAKRYQSRSVSNKTDDGNDDTDSQLSGRDLQDPQNTARPSTLGFAAEDYKQQLNLRTRGEHRGYPDFGTMAQETRPAQVGLDGQKYHGERVTPQTTHRLPRSINLLCPQTCVPSRGPVTYMQEQPRTQRRQDESTASEYWMRKSTNDFLSSARARMRARERTLTDFPPEVPKIQPPAAATPDRSYLSPQRIAGPVRTVDTDQIERGIVSDLALSVHLKSKLAGQEAYRRYKEDERKKELERRKEGERKKEEERRKAIMSFSKSEANRTESVKRLLTNVNKALEQKIEAAELEAADTERGCFESKAFQAQSQQPHPDPKNAHRSPDKFHQNFWHEYTANYPKTRPPTGTHCAPSFDPASVQPPIASPGHSEGADGLPRHSRPIPQRKSPFNPICYSAAIEAINQMSSDRSRSPKTASGPENPAAVKHNIVSKLPTGAKCETASLHFVSHREQSVNHTPKSNVSPTTPPPAVPLVSGTSHTSENPDTRSDGEGTAETAPVEDQPVEEYEMVEMGWEDFDDDDQAWSCVEKELEHHEEEEEDDDDEDEDDYDECMWKGSSDAEWAAI